MFKIRYSRLLLATCLALFCAAPARSDDTAPDTSAASDWGPLQPHAGALLFLIGPNLTVGAFDGTTISYKTHRAAASAWRFGVTLNASTGTRNDGVRQTLNDTTANAATVDMDFNSSSIGVNAVYLRYMTPVERVSLYLGGGPSINWLHARSQQAQHVVVNAGGLPGDATSTSTRDSYAAGLDGVLGVEWFCARRISLIGEYSCGVAYVHDEFEDTTQIGPPPPSRTDRNSDSDGFNFNSGGARAGVSVYFR